MGNLTMDIKQRLQQVIELNKHHPELTWLQACRDALAEIERLEKITGVGVSLEMYETLRRERDAAAKLCREAFAEIERLEAFERAAARMAAERTEQREPYPASLAQLERIVTATEKIATTIEYIARFRRPGE